MEKVITKRNAVLVSSILFIFSLVGQYGLNVDSLGQYKHTLVSLYKSLIWFSFAMLTFSIFLSLLRVEFFRNWARFVCYWVPFQATIVSLVIFVEKDKFFPLPYVTFAETTSIFLTIAFIILSIVLVLTTATELSGSEKMDKIIENGLQWLTRRRLLILGTLSTLVFVPLAQSDVSYLIYQSLGPNYVTLLNILLFMLVPCVTIFVSSLFIRKHVYEFWKTTLGVYIFAYLYIILAVPNYLGDEWLHIEKDMVALSISVFYVAISFVFGIFIALGKMIDFRLRKF